MRLITTFLTAAFIALFPTAAQAYKATCLPSKEMHAALTKRGLFLYTYGMTNGGFMISTYVGYEEFVMLAESAETSCILSDGIVLYQITGQAI